MNIHELHRKLAKANELTQQADKLEKEVFDVIKEDLIDPKIRSNEFEEAKRELLKFESNSIHKLQLIHNINLAKRKSRGG